MTRKGSNQHVGVFVGPPDMEPLNTLGAAGSALWGRVWAANDGTLLNIDAHLVQMLCECVDERSTLRERVVGGGDWRDRVALRTLDAEISKMLHLLGLDPLARHRLGGRARSSAPSGVLDELRAKRDRLTPG
jgi:hypothetical protein